MPYKGDTRVFSVAETGEGPFSVIGRQTEGSPEGEREEIEAGHKFSNFNDVLPGRQSGSISITVQDMDGENDPGQEIMKTSYEAGSLIYIREEKWDGNDVTTLTPVRQTTGYLLSDPLGRDMAMDELATAELEVTRTSRWIKIGISVSPASASITTTTTQQLTVTDSSGADVTASATYESSDTGVATVSTGGLVSGVAAGTATITATYQGSSATSEITVS